MDISDIIHDELSKLSQELIEKYDELGMRASGEWAEAVEVMVTINVGKILGLDYTQELAFGRPPNKNSSPEVLRRWVGWAGSTFIAKWVKDKGLPHDPFAVAWKIAREGTNYHPLGTDLIDGVITTGRVAEMMTNIGNKVSVRMADNFREELQRA